MTEGNDRLGAWRCTEGGRGVVAASEGDGGGQGGIMLFGVRVSTEGSFPKSASMNNLSQYEHMTSTVTPDNPGVVEAGYTSDDVVHQSRRCRKRKRGMPWTEEEHRLFLIGLQKVGKGDWRGISRSFVKTRTPTQVASHAQKYFLRRSNKNRLRLRSSLFDITTESQFVGPSMTIDESQVNHEITIAPSPLQPNLSYISEKFPVPTCSLSLVLRTTTPEKGETSAERHRTAKPRRPIVPIPPPSSKMDALDLHRVNSTDVTLDPQPPSLKLSMQEEKPTPSSSSFKAMSSGDSSITVS